MNVADEVKAVLDSVLQLNGRTAEFDSSTPLLGAIPELDSQAVVAVVTGLEVAFEIVLDDEDITAEAFETFGSLVSLVEQRL
ncbi:MAG: hypothetical protein K9J81_00820 [Desulfohalobiaceae bacterium]|nr:hypothetical protein [Desulfohalobiaceae bacterium]